VAAQVELIIATMQDQIKVRLEVPVEAVLLVLLTTQLVQLHNQLNQEIQAHTDLVIQEAKVQTITLTQAAVAVVQAQLVNPDKVLLH
jgi:hypothetical protein